MQHVAMGSAGRRLRFSHAVIAVLFAGALGAAALVGAFVGRGLGQSDTGRGTRVHLGTRLAYNGGVFCIPYHHVCLVQPAEGDTPTAFYTFTTHPLFREQGCEVTWEPDQTFDAGGTPIRGIFREGCGGAVFDRSGKRLFGPAPRGLDQFKVSTTPDAIIVDTRTLTCEGLGTSPNTPCVLAPRGD